MFVLVVAAAGLYLFFLGGRDLWNPNEPLYGQVVVEMAQRGDWLVPTVNGEVFDEKPILYFWLALVASKLGGVNAWTLRLPSALAAVVGVLLTWSLVRPYAGRLRAELAGALFGTMYIVFWSARQVQMDLLLAVCVLGVVVSASRVIDHGLSPWRGWSLAGLAAGLAVLAKGPVGLIAPGLTLVLYTAATRRLSVWRHPAILLGAGVCVAVVLPWFVMLWVRGDAGLLTELLYRQNVTRFLAPWDHDKPWWYFFREFWIDMAPWSWFTPLALFLPGRDDDERRMDRLAWIWILGLLVFFSLGSSKRSPYLLPLAPAVAVLVSGVGQRWFEGRLGAGRSRALLVLHGAFGAIFAAGAAYCWLRVFPAYPAIATSVAATALLLAVGGVCLLAAVGLRSRAVATLLLGTVVALYVLAAGSVLPAADAYKSWRPFGEAVRVRVAPDRPLHAYRIWKWRAAYTYYSGRRIARLESKQELEAYWSRDDEVFLIVERGMLPEARSVLGDTKPLEATPLGSNFAYLFSNKRP